VRRTPPHKLATVTTYVPGFAPAPAPAPARAHAAALPSDFYNLVVRPTVVPVPLSGKMHVEYQLYRERANELLDVLPNPINELALPEPELAFARGELLQADLIEAERVGNARSLIQPPRTSENAGAVLRRMRHRRAAQLERLLRFGDHLVAATATPADRDEPVADSGPAADVTMCAHVADLDLDRSTRPRSTV